MKASVRTHPETLYARIQNSTNLIIKAENQEEPRWVEADIRVPEKLSLAPDVRLNEGRMRLGIVEKDEVLEKSIKIYASAFSDAQDYTCKITIFTYDKDAVIDQRMELEFQIKCEDQKPAIL